MEPRRLAALLLVLATFAQLACSGARRGRQPDAGAVERGIASWYGSEFHGRPTASGERYDMHAFTAAHRSLPFGAVVEVRNLDNGRKVEVRITDRGPFVRGRIIDLSYSAAAALGLIGPGTARVELRVLQRPPQPPGGLYVVQAGAFREADRADALYQRLRPAYPEVAVRSDGSWHRVQIGPFATRERARSLAKELLRMGIAAIVKVQR